MARVLGLTGGIATGKSTVSAILSDRAAIVDADRLAREVVEPGQEAWREIVELFGREALREDQTLDRAVNTLVRSMEVNELINRYRR